MANFTTIKTPGGLTPKTPKGLTPTPSKILTTIGRYTPVKKIPEIPEVGVREVIKELPVAAKIVTTGIAKFAKSIQEEIARSGASVALTLTGALTGERELDISGPEIENKVARVIFGNRPLKSVETRIAEAELGVKDFGKSLEKSSNQLIKSFGKFSEENALGLSIIGVGAVIGLDFTGAGGAKNAAKAIAKSKSPEFIAGILRQINVAEDFIPSVSKKLATITKEEEVLKAIKKINEIQKTTKVVREEIVPAIKAIPLDKSGKSFIENIINKYRPSKTIITKQGLTTEIDIPWSKEKIYDYAQRIAKKEGSDSISANHLAEAFQYQKPVEGMKYWLEQKANGYYQNIPTILDAPYWKRFREIAGEKEFSAVYEMATGVKVPSPLEKIGEILPEMRIGQVAGELPPIVRPTELPSTILPRAKAILPLKETGEQYTAKELSLDTLYQKTGISKEAAKEAETISKELPTNPTKWNRFRNIMGEFETSFKEKIVSDWQKVKELKTEGMKLTSELTPYERRKLMAGRQTARLQKTEEVVNKIDKDILETSKKLKIKDTELQNEVFDYLKARHAPERNAVLGEKAAGITTKEAGEITARIEKSTNSAEIKRIANDLQKFHNETLDILYQNGKPEGVISKELYDLLKIKYKNHIPLQRVMDTDDIAEVLSGRGLAVRGAGLKRAVGSEREVKDIMENIYTARTQAIQRVEKNIVDNETFNFAEDYIKSFPEQDLFEIIKPKAIGKTFEGKIITKNINSPDVLQFQRHGKPTYIKINDPRLAVALRGVNREQLPAMMRYISAVTRWMSALVTRYSPEFVLSNKIRDMQEAVVYMASQKEIGLKGAAKTLVRDPVSINDVKNFILGKETAGTKLYQQMIEDGGTTGGMALSTRKQVEETLESIRSTNRSISRKGFKGLAESVDKWNTVFEDSTRLSAYRTALENGLSRDKAAVIAKNVSIDFNEFGTWGPIVNSMYMFANASIQGSAKMIRAMRNPKVAAAVTGTVGASVFAVNTWNDNVDSEWRNKVSKWDKLNGLNIVIPGTEEFHYISIPVSWGLKPIKVVMEYGSDIVSGQKVETEDAIEGIFVALMEGYNPVGGTDFASALTPSPIEPFIDIARNRQWTGGKIRPDWNKYAPSSTQYFKDLSDSQTGKILIDISQSVSEATGGRIEFSPADAEYILQQITGGPGKFAGKVFNSISAIGKAEVPEPRDMPFVSRVLRKTPEDRFYTSTGEENIIKTLTEQERVKFYNKQEAEKMFEELKKMPIEQRKETYIRLKTEDPNLIKRIDDIADEEEKGLTRLDRQILQLNVENGERAKYLFKVFKSAEPQEKEKLYVEYFKKGIISKNVRKQLDYLFAHPDVIKF